MDDEEDAASAEWWQLFERCIGEPHLFFQFA
jgi:hypothetical protein